MDLLRRRASVFAAYRMAVEGLASLPHGILTLAILATLDRIKLPSSDLDALSNQIGRRAHAAARLEDEAAHHGY